MDEAPIVNAVISTECTACLKNVNPIDSFCENCGYPLKGSEKEQRYFMSVRNSKAIDLDDANKKIKRAGYVLYFIGAFTLIFGFISYTVGKDHSNLLPALIVNSILAIIYAALGLFSGRKPLAAIISGFALYALIFLLNAVTNPLTIVSGIFFKIFIVGCFIKGIKSAIEAEKIKKELNIE